MLDYYLVSMMINDYRNRYPNISRMAAHSEGDEPPRKKRKGGLRQRLQQAAVENIGLESSDAIVGGYQAAAASSSSTGNPKSMPSSSSSRLVRNLLRDFAWGEMSAQKLQEICASSVQDLKVLRQTIMDCQQDETIIRWPRNSIQNDQETVAGIGVDGQYSNKCYADLMKKVETNITLPQPHREHLKFAGRLGEQVQEMLLPYEMFAAFYQCKPTWSSVIVPDPDLLSKFWNSQKKGHPQWKGHPLESFSAEQLQKMVPISLHGDEVPVTGIGKQWSRKMVNFSWHSLVSSTASVRDSQFFIWALFDKAGLTGEEIGNDGYNTLWNFFKVLSWSFEFLFKGIFPTHDVNGKKQLSSSNGSS